MWRYSRALALAANGKVAEADKERELFVAEVGAFPPDTKFGEMNKARDVLDVAVHVIDGRIAAAKGQKDAAIEHWTKAVAIQDTAELRRARGLVLSGA